MVPFYLQFEVRDNKLFSTNSYFSNLFLVEEADMVALRKCFTRNKYTYATDESSLVIKKKGSTLEMLFPLDGVNELWQISTLNTLSPFKKTLDYYYHHYTEDTVSNFDDHWPHKLPLATIPVSFMRSRSLVAVFSREQDQVVTIKH